MDIHNNAHMALFTFFYTHMYRYSYHGVPYNIHVLLVT